MWEPLMTSGAGITGLQAQSSPCFRTIPWTFQTVHCLDDTAK